MFSHGAPPPELIEQIRNVYKKSGVIDRERVGQPIQLKEFMSLIKEIQPLIQNMNGRVVPSSFDPDDENLMAFPLPLSYSWSSCERALVANRPSGVMMRAPLFWQLEAPLHAACHVAGAPIFVNDRANMPVGGAAIQLAEMDTVVTSADDAVEFAAYLSEKKIPHPRLWILVTPLSEFAGGHIVPRDGVMGRVVEEIHLFPGVVLLEQCEELAAARSGFHLSDSFHWEVGAAESLITSQDKNAPIPLARIVLPLAFSERGVCPCGQIIFQKSTDI